MKRKRPLRLLELFAGYGGLGRAAETALGARTAGVAEWDDAPSKVLARRFPGVLNLKDVTTADWASVAPIDVISGGSPCQDLSTSGARGGMIEGTRSNLWVSQREAIALLRPKFVVWENVRGAYSAKAACASDPTGQTGALRALGRVIGDMHALGYDAEWRGIQAADVGAPHPRPRVFMLAWDRDQVARSSDQEKILGLWDEGADLWRRYDKTALGGYGDPFMDRLPASGSMRSGTFAARTVWNKPHRPKEMLFPTPMVFDNQWIFHAPGNDNPGFMNTIVHSFSPTPALAKERIVGMQKHRQEKNGWKVPLSGHVAGWGPYRPAILRWEQVTGNKAPKPTIPFHKDGRYNVNPAFMEWVMGLDPGWITDLYAPGVTPKECGPEQLTAHDVWKMCGNGVVPQQAEAALADMHAHTDHA